MTLSIEISPELESKLRDEASRQGIRLHQYVINLIGERPRSSRLERNEAQLLEQINRGLPPELWERHRELVKRRQSERLTAQEQAELIALSDRIEEANAQRIQSLSDLARLRDTSLKCLMQQLGIEPPSHAA